MAVLLSNPLLHPSEKYTQTSKLKSALVPDQTHRKNWWCWQLKRLKVITRGQCTYLPEQITSLIPSTCNRLSFCSSATENWSQHKQWRIQNMLVQATKVGSCWFQFDLLYMWSNHRRCFRRPRYCISSVWWPDYLSQLAQRLAVFHCHGMNRKLEAHNFSSHHRPDDVLLPNWSCGSAQAVDVTVTKLLQTNTIRRSEAGPGIACRLVEYRKIRASENLPDASMQLFPLAFKTSGGIGPMEVDFLNTLANHCADNNFQMCQLFNDELHRFSANMIIARLPQLHSGLGARIMESEKLQFGQTSQVICFWKMLAFQLIHPQGSRKQPLTTGSSLICSDKPVLKKITSSKQCNFFQIFFYTCPKDHSSYGANTKQNSLSKCVTISVRTTDVSKCHCCFTTAKYTSWPCDCRISFNL